MGRFCAKYSRKIEPTVSRQPESVLSKLVSIYSDCNTNSHRAVRSEVAPLRCPSHPIWHLLIATYK